MCQQLSLHGGPLYMNKVSLLPLAHSHAALQVSVSLEFAKASLILKIEPTSRR